jgi:flagellar basal-body rod modification protein FlgD
MSSIGPTATSPDGATSPTSGAKKHGRATLGKDDFLKLLVTQLQHQDPLNPMDDMQFMGQMAQFSTLEQITNLGTELERMSLASQFSQGVGLIGRTVSYETASGSTVSGTAQSVELDDGKMTVLVDGQKVKPESIRSVS